MEARSPRPAPAGCSAPRSTRCNRWRAATCCSCSPTAPECATGGHRQSTQDRRAVAGGARTARGARGAAAPGRSAERVRAALAGSLHGDRRTGRRPGARPVRGVRRARPGVGVPGRVIGGVRGAGPGGAHRPAGEHRHVERRRPVPALTVMRRGCRRRAVADRTGGPARSTSSSPTRPTTWPPRRWSAVLDRPDHRRAAGRARRPGVERGRKSGEPCSGRTPLDGVRAKKYGDTLLCYGRAP